MARSGAIHPSMGTRGGATPRRSLSPSKRSLARSPTMRGKLRLRWVAVLLGLMAALAGGARVMAAVGGSSVQGPLTFNWSMAERFGMDADGDGLIDESTASTYVNPSSYKASFDACSSPAATSAGANADFTWTFTATSPAYSKVVTGKCKVDNDFPRLGDFSAQAQLLDGSGAAVATVTQAVTLKDYLVVSVGDSVASGEGNPDTLEPAPLGPFP